MQFTEINSTQPDSAQAVEEIVSQAAGLVSRIDAAILFFTSHHVQAAPAIAARVCAALGTECLIGCSAGDVVANGQEWEQSPVLCLWIASLPEGRAVPMHLQYEPHTDGGSFVGWPVAAPATLPPDSVLILLGDPFTFPADRFLERANQDHPGMPVVGGMASAGMQPGANRLLIGPHVEPAGAVALWLQGDFSVRTVVSQGCRPIGDRYVITRAQGNLIQELSGLPALEQLQTLFPKLSSAEQQLVREGLQLGRVMNEHQGEFSRGDFLIRAVLAADGETGALGVGDLVRVGQTVQFQIRDAEAASEDLADLLNQVDADSSGPPAGGLLFTCNGRGTRLFDAPDHDVNAIRHQWPGLPMCGFFAAGELGPVGGRGYLHGFTASIALFYS